MKQVITRYDSKNHMIINHPNQGSVEIMSNQYEAPRKYKDTVFIYECDLTFSEEDRGRVKFYPPFPSHEKIN